MLTNPFKATVKSIEYVHTSPMGHNVYRVTTDWGQYNTKSNAYIGLYLYGGYGKATFEGKLTLITLSARGTITDMHVIPDSYNPNGE